MRSLPGAFLLFLLLPLPLPGVQDPSASPKEGPREAEQALYQALRQGLPAEEIRSLAEKAAARFPRRPYPWAVLGDALFRLRRLGSAARAYRKALSLMDEPARRGPLGKRVRENLALLEKELALLERGLALEARARWAGRAVLLLLAGLICWLWLGG